MSEPAPEPVSEPDAPPAVRWLRRPVLWLAGVLLAIAVEIAAAPFWAPAVMHLLPWGAPPPPPSPPPQAAQDPALAARLAALEAARGDQAKIAAALQQLTQRIAGLEAKPAPPAPPPAADLTPVQQQLAALSKAVADLNATVATLETKPPPAPAVDPGTALALVLLQIREAIDVARPFKAEYGALLALAHDRPEIAAAAAPLAQPATAGVASRAALADRLRQLAPQIAATPPPSTRGWWGRITRELRSLVTIRRIEGAGQTAEEAAVSNAQRALASGDLSAAAAALDGLSGPAKEAAEPWLRMARDRLAVETALHRIEALVTAQLGGAAPAKTGAPG